PVYMLHGKDDPYSLPATFEDRRYQQKGLERWAYMGFAVFDLDGATMKVRYLDENGDLQHEEDGRRGERVMFGDDDSPFHGKGSALGRLLMHKPFESALKNLRDQVKEKGDLGTESEVDFFFRLLSEAKGEKDKPIADLNQWLDTFFEKEEFDTNLGEELLYLLKTGPARRYEARGWSANELLYDAQILLAGGDYSGALARFKDLAANDDWLKANWKYLDSVLPELRKGIRNDVDLVWMVLLKRRLDQFRPKTSASPDADHVPDKTSPSEHRVHVPADVLPDELAGKKHPERLSDAAGAKQPAAASPVTFELTPHLDLDRVEPLKAADRFSVTVRLDNTPAAKGETTNNVRAAAYSRVEVTFAASAHFRFEGSRTLEFIADPGKDRILLQPV